MNGLRHLREFQHHITKLKELLFQMLSRFSDYNLGISFASWEGSHQKLDDTTMILLRHLRKGGNIRLKCSMKGKSN